MMRCHLTLVPMAAINKSNKQLMLARMWGMGNPNALLVGMQSGAPTVANSKEFPQTIKKGELPFDPEIPPLALRNLKHQFERT